MIRVANSRVEVAWVPKRQLTEALQVFEPFLSEGLQQDPDLDVDEVLTDLIKGEAKLGIVYEIDPFTPQGAWISDLRESAEGKTFVSIYALAGREPNKWGGAIGELVGRFARDSGAYSYRWYGRLGWIKFAKGIKLLETVNNRVGLFEKVVIQ